MQIINGFRLSPQQKSLWKLQQDSAAYWAQCAILLEGDINTDILKKALQNVIDQFEILRTSFPRQPGVKFPVQAIASSSVPAWHFVNLNEYDGDIEAKIEEIFQEERGVSFDGEKPPIRRITLIKLSEIRQILILSLPSLCADSWTLENLVKELSQSYIACLKGQEVSDEVVQYVQFSEWQNQLLEDEDAEAGKTYWLQQNLSEFANLKLPFERQQPDRLGKFELDFFEKKISPSVGEKIEAIAREYQISPSVFLLACWKILLWRLAGKSEIVIKRAFAGRNYEELEPALGLFAKYLPLRTHLEENKLFSEILQQIQTAKADAIEWQEYFSGEEIGVSALPFGFEFEERSENYSAGEVSFSIYKKYVCFDKFKIKLSCYRKDEAIAAEFQYDPSWIAAEGIHCLAEQFQAVVESAATHPETTVGQLDILSGVQRQQVLVEFNHTNANYSTINQCIHELFEEQVKKTPNQIAVVFENQQLTYAELNAKANKIARYLQKIGVKPERVVGFCIERSLESIVGLLGILKAGGAYLPLDPALPKQRLTLTLQDSQATVLLTQQHLTEVVSDMPVQVVYLESEAIASESEENPKSGALPNHLVYILYTSGSTGTPKGVAVEHQQLVNYFNGIVERLELPQEASFATVSTLAADLGNTAIFPALLTGGCLHIIASERISDPDAIAEYFHQNAIDCLKIVPSHLEALLSGSHPENILPRKRLILGGESCSWALIDKVQKLAPDCTIFNHYGPTETTVGATTYRVEKDGKNRFSATVPIGRPLGNVQIYLLDDRAQPVAIGVAGEVYIGGSGIARGYLNRPDLTAEKFISNPFANEPGEKLYKTGDRARYLSDGNIEFIGRIDNQVKIRGFRIELGEIEALLATHPDVKETTVIVREDSPNNKLLLAYIVPQPEKDSVTVSKLRSFLKGKLPDYMVPNALILLDRMPLTANGKIDRQNLPDRDRSDLETDFTPASDALEIQLKSIWQEVLGVTAIGVKDNFFELGGHSLLAVRLFAQIEKVFDKNLPLATLFQAPTIEQLADILRKKGWSSPWKSLVLIQPGKSAGKAEALSPLFCIHAVGGNVLSYQTVASYLVKERPVYGLQARGLDGKTEPHATIEEMAADYIKEMRIVQPHGPYFLVGHSSGGVVAFEIAQQLVTAGEKVALVALFDSYSPILLGQKTPPISYQLYIHWFNLKRLKPKEKLIYILDRVRWNLERLGQKITNKFYAWMSRPLPNELPEYLQRIESANRQAVKNYVSQVYPGKVTLFRAIERPTRKYYQPDLGWMQLAGEVEIIEVPGHHKTMILEPRVRFLGKELQACLDRIQD